MPLPNPIGEPAKELESLIPGIVPSAPSILPAIGNNKPLLYQTDGASDRAEQINLTELASQPQNKSSLAATDAFILNKDTATNGIHPASSTATEADSNPPSADSLIGSSSAPKEPTADPLTNPGAVVGDKTDATESGAVDSKPAATDAPTPSDSNGTNQTTTSGSATNSATTINATPIEFSGGTFKVLEVPGQESGVGIEFLSDGGLYRGELAIFSLEGMDKFVPGSPEFIKEAARRASSNSYEGYVVISDATEAAKLPSYLPEGDFNSGEYKGVKTFAMKPGTEFGFMLVPNGTVQFVYDNPNFGGDKQPLFSMVTANPDDAFRVGQIADITGDGSTFAIEDMGVAAAADGDYNDVIFRVTGAKTTNTASIGQVINPRLDWRTTEWGKNLIEAAAAQPESPKSTVANSDKTEQQKNETVGGVGQGETPTTQPTIAGSSEPEPDDKETTIAGTKPVETPKNTAVAGAENSETPPTKTVANADKSETLPTATTVVAGETTASETTETAVATVGKSETPATGTTATDAVGSVTPKTGATVTGAVGSEPSKTEETVADSVGSETSKTETKVTDAVGSETSKTETKVTDAVGSETSKTEKTVGNAVGSEPAAKEITATDAVGSEPSKPKQQLTMLLMMLLVPNRQQTK